MRGIFSIPMAVTGVQGETAAPRAWYDGLMFWGVMYRRVSVAWLLRGSWWFALGAGALGALLLPLLAGYKGGAGLHALLGWLVLLHLGARGWVERRLPDPSFASDLRTGNLEQLRLTPHTAHTLLIQRGLPDWLFRALTMSLWLPLYALAAGVLGLTFGDALALWTLFSFANYFVLGLVSLALLASAWEGVSWLLHGALLGYAFLLDGGRTRTAVSSSGLFSVMIALPILGRVLLPQHLIVALPDLRGFALLWLLIEALRFERLARWLNAPSGLWRGFYGLPCLALIALGWLTSYRMGEAQGYFGGAQTQYAAVGVMTVVGYLSILLLTLRRQAESVAQPLHAHLIEVGLLRLLGLLIIGVAITVWGLPTGSSAFWGVLLWLSGVEWWGGVLARHLLQRAHSRAAAWAYGALLLGATPALVFTLAPQWSLLGALSPVYALLMASDAWSIGRGSVQPQLLWCMVMPIVRYLGVLGVAVWGVRGGMSTHTHPALRWLTLPLLYPLLDWMAQRQVQNPLTRLTIAERQPPFALILGVAAFASTVFDSSGSNWQIVLLIPLGIFLWLWGYHSTAKRVRRWLDTGELSSALLAGLTPQQLFWGWVYGAWHQQGRVLLAVSSGAVLGWLIAQAMRATVSGAGWGFGWIAFVMSFTLGIQLVYLALWSCAWLIAAPAAIRDQLTALQAASPLITPRTVLQSAFYSLLACCAPLAPFLLVGLPIYASQSTIKLHQLARAPGELKR
ncbi:MAG: hypothetical protein KatS3mg019_1928 [Fimbriimonadales bacterium]|nr:MAG: hypothetical protein KatS3mg019_1928 [Fimbriimonadales bacterium]